MEIAAPSARQLVKFSFFKVAPEWRRLPPERRRDGVAEFTAVVERHAATLPIRSYSTLGTRGDCDFCLRAWSPEVAAFTALHADLGCTDLGAFLTQTHSYLAMLRKSVYVHVERNKQDPLHGVTFDPAGRTYLFIYPFVKTRAWYALTQEDRQRMMDEHIAIGRSYPGISINTSYSFGLDDQEFVVAFEGDKIADFLDLVMELRSAESSQYTLRDTPSFTCTAQSIEETIRPFGG